MRWYEGSIAEAVTASKKKGAIFVVFLEGDDDKSQKLADIIDDDDVSDCLESQHFVAIKVKAQTTPHLQFQQIYKQAAVPSLFFIGKGGQAIEIIYEPSSVAETRKIIDALLQRNGYPPINTAGEDSSTSLITKEDSSTSLPFEEEEKAPARGAFELVSSEPSTSTTSSEVASEEEIADTKSRSTSFETSARMRNEAISIKSTLSETTSVKSQQSEGTSASKQQSQMTSCNEMAEKESTTSVEHKVEKAMKLMEQLREAKEAEETEKDRLSEIERRKVGQDVQKLKRWQEDEEMKRLMEEKEREKQELRAARERILQQIAQDKVERAAKFGTLSPSASPTSINSQPVRRTTAPSNSARLQFKLPDGTSHTRDFNSSDTLLTVRNYVSRNVQLPFQNYLLSTAFPRREFSNDENARSLSDLELVPNAVILVLPANQGAVVRQSGSGVTGLLWTFFSPVFFFCGYLKRFIFGIRDGGTRPPTNGEGGSVQKRPSEFGETSSIPFKRKLGDIKSSFRQDGNVHRLTDQQDDDDENNTWNGNSTQQM